jgi:polyphosphate kinase
MGDYSFFNRDLSWLSFNKRVLEEAASTKVPLMEKIRFLSIYSSNLDEFYRVRMPVLKAIDRDQDIEDSELAYRQAKRRINLQQQHYGEIVRTIVIPALAEAGCHWVYRSIIPDAIAPRVQEIFNSEIKALLKPVYLNQGEASFFAENNKLYLGVVLQGEGGSERFLMLNIPSDVLPRLYSIPDGTTKHILFVDDIIRFNLQHLFKDEKVIAAYALKVTRDAELHLEEEVDENIVAAMEKELAKRDYGIATRFLCQPDVPLRHLYSLMYALNLQHSAVVLGGYYHNLKDLNTFPLTEAEYAYPEWTPLSLQASDPAVSIFDRIQEKDLLINLPYQSFDPVISFFETAATDPLVTEIYCTLYRVAKNSRVVTALINAAHKGKKVVVMLELKARFDEENNIKWATRLKAAGAEVVYSSVKYKVHAKVALVKKTTPAGDTSFGLLSTGNLNESTAKFYTDHVLLTAAHGLTMELESLFQFMATPEKTKGVQSQLTFRELLVAQFNLQDRFLALITQEIKFAKAGLPAAITIKLNNLEEKILISKLYDASNAGVKIKLIVRGICCLIPGIPGQSENIRVTRIVDRYLEHGRVFIFHNNGNKAVLMGSADWMNRNIYSRIEVCFPIHDPQAKQQIEQLISIQLNDTEQAVELDSGLENHPIPASNGIRSQQEIYNLLKAAQ